MTRSLFIVRLVQPFPGLEGYDTMLSNYWSAVKAQLDRQAITSGAIKRIFVETVTGRGEDALIQLQQINPEASQLVRNLIASGSVIEDFEDTELLTELIDWGQCGAQNLMSDKVRRVVHSGQVESAGARDEHLQKRLNDAIGDDEFAVVFAISGQMPVPDRIERFIVSPPELDQLERWLRAKMEEARREMMEEAQRQAGQQPSQAGGSNQPSSGGLWTPP